MIARNRSYKDFAGFAVEKGRGNRIARNHATRPRRYGIYVGLTNPPIGSKGTAVRRNRVRGSGRDGFFVAEKNRNTQLSRNRAVGSEDDGFDVNSRSATLTNNRARRNGDLGIEAVRGVNDGGGNRAANNGDRRQCTHVFCR